MLCLEPSQRTLDMLAAKGGHDIPPQALSRATWRACAELLSNSRLTRSADVYSYGMVMWELITGEVWPLLTPDQQSPRMRAT